MNNAKFIRLISISKLMSFFRDLFFPSK